MSSLKTVAPELIESRKVFGKINLAMLLLLFCLLRVVYCFFFGWQEIPYGSDGFNYNKYALAILEQTDWLTSATFQGHYRPPGYPLFLALTYTIFGLENLFAVYCFQAALSTLTIYYVYSLSIYTVGKRSSFLVLFWAGLDFFYLRYTGMISRETLIFFLLIFSFYNLWLFFQGERSFHCLKSTYFWAFIIVFTFLLHTDPRYLFYIPFFLVLFVLYSDFWKGVKDYSWVLAMLILFLVPWTVRNYIAYNGFVLINTRTIDTRQKGLPLPLAKLKNAEITRERNIDYPSEAERVLVKKGENPKNRSSEETRIIREGVYASPTFLGRKLYRLKEMWIPFRTWSDYEPLPAAKFIGPWSFRHNLASITFYGTLIPFAIVGLLVLYKKRNNAVWFLLFPIAIQALLHFLMWGKERYRIPVDAFIIILGCYGISLVYETAKRRFSIALSLRNKEDLSRALLNQHEKK